MIIIIIDEHTLPAYLTHMFLFSITKKQHEEEQQPYIRFERSLASNNSNQGKVEQSCYEEQTADLFSLAGRHHAEKCARKRMYLNQCPV